MMKRFLFVSSVLAAVAARAVSFEEARDVYQKCFTNPPPSLVTCGDYIFHVFDSYPGSEENETVMRDQFRALADFIGKPEKVESPFEPDLAKELLPMVAFKVPTFRAFTIERKYHGNNLRLVTAMEAAPVLAAREEANVGRPAKRSLNEWALALNSAFLAKEDDVGQLCLLSMLGTTRRILSEMPTVAIMGRDVDFVLLKSAEASWPGVKADRAACLQMLSVNPVFAPALSRLAELEGEEGNLICALAYDLLAGAATNPDVSRVMSRADALASKTHSTVWKEFASLYGMFQSKDLAFGGKAPFWGAVRRTAGRVDFKTRSNRADDKGAFEKAKSLFRPYKGKDVKKDLAAAMELLVMSIEIEPADSEKWRYYAAALRAAKLKKEAALAYLQTLTLNPSDNVAAADLVLMLDGLGLKKMAEGDAWWLLITTSPDDASHKKAETFIRRLHGGVFAD